MNTVAAFRSTEVSAVYPICHVRFYFYYDINQHIFRHIDFCLVVSRLHGNDAGVSGLLKNFFWFLLLLFFIRHTDTKSAGNAFDAKQTTKQTIVKKRGMALLSPKQHISSSTLQVTSSPRSPCAASSQAFSVKRFGDIAETNGKTRSAHVTRNS